MRKLLLLSLLLSSFAFADRASVLLPSTLTSNGETFEGVTYRGHDESHVKIFHDSGAASIPIADLPPHTYPALGYSEAKAERYQHEKASKAAFDAIKAEREAAAAKEKSAQAAKANKTKHGTKPLWGESLFGGFSIPAAVKRNVKSQLVSPSSFEVIKLVSMIEADHNGTPCYQLIFNFSSANRLGGKDWASAMYYVRNGQVLSGQIFQD